MSTGPIEFVGESKGQDVPATEFGGADGLIQPEVDGGAFLGSPESRGGHVIKGDSSERGIVGERAAVMARRAMQPLNSREGWTGESDTGEDVQDPHTGRMMPGDNSKLGTGAPGELSPLQP